MPAQPVPAQPVAVPQSFPESLEEYAARIAMRIALVAGIVMGLIVILANPDRNPVPLVGDTRAFGTLGLLSIAPITLVAAVIGYVLGVNAWNERVAETRRRTWPLPVLPVALSYALMVLVLSFLTLRLMEFSFSTLALAKFQGAFIVAAAGGALIYWAVQQVIQVTSMKMIQVVTVILAGGVYLATARIEDPFWWQESFSYLGTLESTARRIFNVSLIFAGILLLIWQSFLSSDFRILVRHGLAPESSIGRFRLAFTVLAVAIALVGAFPWGDSRFSSIMHNLSAFSLAGVFIFMLLFVRRLVPGFSRDFVIVSWSLMAAIIATLLLAAIGYFNTVGLEFVCFALIITWLQLFMRAVEIQGHKLEPTAFPT
jgi:hypothetical protein